MTERYQEFSNLAQKVGTEIVVGPHGTISLSLTNSQGQHISVRDRQHTHAFRITEVVIRRFPEERANRADLINANIRIGEPGEPIEIVDQYQDRFVLDPHQGALIYRNPEEIA